MSAPLIRALSPEDRPAQAAWDAFAMTHPQATFFHRAGWLHVLRDVFGHQGHFLYAERDGAVVGVLPLAEVKSMLFGRTLVGLPFASYGGVVANDTDAQAALEAEAVRLSRALGVDYLELRNTTKQQDWPVQDLYVAFRMPIPAVLDEKMLGIPQKRRNMVRKALKLGLHAVPDDTVANFFPTFAQNARDHGTPTLPRRYFEKLCAVFGHDCGVVSVYNKRGMCVSSILCFVHGQHVLAYYAGELPEARGTAANDLKYWEVMKWAQGRGCTVFDIGRSKKDTGSYEFKRLWGFEPVQLHYQYVLRRQKAIPQKNPMNPRYRLLIRAWQKLPLPVANLLGPFLVRSLG